MLNISMEKLEHYVSKLRNRSNPVPFQIEERGTDSGSFILSYEGEDKSHKFKASKSSSNDEFSDSELKLLAKIKSEAKSWIEKRLAARLEQEQALDALRSELEDLKTWQLHEESSTITAEIAEMVAKIKDAEAILEQASFLAEDARGVQWTKSFFFHYRPPQLEAKDYADFSRVDEILTSPSTTVQSLGALLGPSLGSPLGWYPATYAERSDVVELDLNQAYAKAALNEGIISQKTFDWLATASKGFRLVAFGALATRSQITVFEPEFETVYRNLHHGSEYATKAVEQMEYISEAQFEAIFKAQVFFANKEQFAKMEGWERTTQVRWRETQQPPTRPITAPAFFHIAAKVGRDMEEVAKAANAYFFWVDAIFCPNEGLRAGADRAKELGYEFKIKRHKSIAVKHGSILVLKAGEGQPSPYGIPATSIDKAAAQFNWLTKTVERYAKSLTPSQVLQLANGKVTKGNFRRVLQKLGLELRDMMDLITVTRDGLEYEVGDFLQDLKGEDEDGIFRLITKDALQKIAEVSNKNTYTEDGVFDQQNWWIQIAVPSSTNTLQNIAESKAK